MPARRPVPSAHAALFVLLAACSYEVDHEYSHVVEVADNGACPEADEVAESEGYDSAELVGERVVLVRRPLCWYRVEDRSVPGLCSGTLDSDQTLDQVRGVKRDPRNRETGGEIVCTDGGPVLLLVAGESGCEPTLDGHDVADFPVGLPVTGRNAFPKELLATDDRTGTGTKHCEYVIEGRQTRRPLSCGARGGALN